MDKRRDELKREEEARHKLELDNIKQRFSKKLQIEKEKVQEDNNRLLEESGDIDYQVKLFRSDLMSSQIEQQQQEIERDFQRQVKIYQEETVKKKMERERERIALEFEGRLEREKEKEQRKGKIEKAKLDD